jgi:hypothetical protein
MVFTHWFIGIRIAHGLRKALSLSWEDVPPLMHIMLGRPIHGAFDVRCATPMHRVLERPPCFMGIDLGFGLFARDLYPNSWFDVILIQGGSYNGY